MNVNRNIEYIKELENLLNRLTDRVYYMPHSEETDRPVLGLICGDKCSLVVDSGNSKKHAEEFLAEVGKLNAAPLKYLVITHWHWDHVFGMSSMNLTSICQYKTKEKLIEMQNMKWDDISLDERVKSGEEIEFCRDMIMLEMPNRRDLAIDSVDIAFQETLEIDLGGVTCIIENVQGDHSVDSSIVYVKEHKVMFLGDCICEDLYTGNCSYSKKKLFTMIDKVRNYDVEWYVSSHNAPETRAKMDNFINHLFEIGNAVGSSVSYEEALKEFRKVLGKNPNEEDIYYLNSFINGNKKATKK
jgi:glyoxylase-like metal-dependent hydrolase (beta-lactamase superfamily II)